MMHGRRRGGLSSASRIFDTDESLAENPVFKTNIVKESHRIKEGTMNFYLKGQIECGFFEYYQSCKAVKTAKQAYAVLKDKMGATVEKKHMEMMSLKIQCNRSVIERTNSLDCTSQRATIFQPANKQLLEFVPSEGVLTKEPVHRITCTEYLFLTHMEGQNKVIIEAVMPIDQE